MPTNKQAGLMCSNFALRSCAYDVTFIAFSFQAAVLSATRCSATIDAATGLLYAKISALLLKWCQYR